MAKKLYRMLSKEYSLLLYLRTFYERYHDRESFAKSCRWHRDECLRSPSFRRRQASRCSCVPRSFRCEHAYPRRYRTICSRRLRLNRSGSLSPHCSRLRGEIRRLPVRDASHEGNDGERHSRRYTRRLRLVEEQFACYRG